MGQAEEFEATVLNRNIITVPPAVMKMLELKVDDILVFRKEKNRLIIGRRRRTIVEEETNFTVD